LLVAASAVFAASVAYAQTSPAPQRQFVWPEQMKNRQALPEGMGGQQLRSVMIGFSQSLGVRCTFCHTGTEEMPLWERDFASDANPHKNIARGMVKMVYALNSQTLPAMIGPSDEPRVTCFTCHRGSKTPVALPPAAKPTPAAAPAPAQPPTASERG